MSVRVHAIAKEVNKTSKEMIEILKERGYDIKSASSTLDNITAQSLLEEFQQTEAEDANSEVEENQVEAGSEEEETKEDAKEDAPQAEEQKTPIVKSKADLEKERLEREAAESQPSESVVEEESEKDADFARVWAALSEFRANYKIWGDLGYLD